LSRGPVPPYPLCVHHPGGGRKLVTGIDSGTPTLDMCRGIWAPVTKRSPSLWIVISGIWSLIVCTLENVCQLSDSRISHAGHRAQPPLSVHGPRNPDDGASICGIRHFVCWKRLSEVSTLIRFWICGCVISFRHSHLHKEQ
jgi:hypothetical protein